MRQKVLLGLALGSDVSLLLLDEPTASLDAASRREFIKLIRGIPDRVSVLLASHQFGEIEAIAERVLVLHEGRMLFDGSINDLKKRLDQQLTVWITGQASQHAAMKHYVETSGVGEMVVRNGSIGVRTTAHAGAELLGELTRSGIVIDQLRLDVSSTEDMVERLISMSDQSGDEG